MTSISHLLARKFFLLLLCNPITLLAQSKTGLPEPLTLEAALSFTENGSQYELLEASEALAESEASLRAANSTNDLSVTLNGRLRAVGNDHDDEEDPVNDSAASLFVRKPLYDFGVSDSATEIERLKYQLQQLRYESVRQNRQLAIINQYYDVLNADNEYLRHNEDLAIGFIQFDRARENQELGLASELEVLQAQAAYEIIRQNRYRSENLQRFTRTLLADTLGFPRSPPSDLVIPDLPEQRDLTDDVEALVKLALNNSVSMKIARLESLIAEAGIKSADQLYGPKLDAELELSTYARESGLRDDWRASIYFEVPLYQGGRKSSSVDQAQANYRKTLTRIARTESELRIEILQLWQKIRQSELTISGALVEQDYRDLDLDRSRAEYELEFKTDLGNSMVQYSESRMNYYRALFDLEKAWQKLQMLVGKEALQSLNERLNEQG